MNGARVVLNCKYFSKGSSHKQIIKNLVKYIGTREGVQKPFVSEDNKQLPVTDNQLNLIKNLEKQFGIGYDLPEFEDYINNKTQGTASVYISTMLDNNLHKAMTKKNLVEYIGKRPGADRDERLDHGLFCISDNGKFVEDIDIHALMEEVSNHTGRVWTNVLSLRREDAEEVGYENRDAWIRMFRAKVHDISNRMKIPVSHLKAYGAFHDEGHHPHCHFIVYSSKPDSGCLYSDGIKKLKSNFAHGIFGSRMSELERDKSLTRDELRAKSKEEISELVGKLERKGFSASSELEVRLVSFARRLPKRGRKAYKYLPSELKQDVVGIVDILANEPGIAELYKKWKEYQAQLIRFYKNETDGDFPKLSENETFRPVLNAVVREAWGIRQWLDEHPGYISKRHFGTAFDVKEYESEKPADIAYGHIFSEFSKCCGGRSRKIHHAPQQHFDVTMDKKYREEQRALKKRLGISV